MDDDRRLERLYEQEYANLVRLVSFLLDERERCDDIVQEAFARVLALPTLPAADRLAAYLRSTALNLARSSLRRRQTSTRHAPLVEHDHRRGPTDPAVRAEQELMVQTVRSLPPRQADVLYLRYYLGLSEAEIAAALGVSCGSVKTHSRRGLAALARRFPEVS